MWEYRSRRGGSKGAARSSGSFRRSTPTLPTGHSTLFTHLHHTHLLNVTAAMQQEHRCSTYCLLASKETDMKEFQKKKGIAFLPSGGGAACYRAPHQRLQKSNSHANTSVLPVYKHRLERRNLGLHHRPQTMSGKTCQITQM